MKKNCKTLLIIVLVCFISGCHRELSLRLNGWKKIDPPKTKHAKLGETGTYIESNSDRYGRVLKENPKDEVALYMLGSLYVLKMETQSLGVDYLKQSAKQDWHFNLNVAALIAPINVSNNREYVLKLINEFVDKGGLDENGTDSMRANMCEMIGRIYVSEGLNEKGLEYFHKAVYLQPDDVFLGVGKTYYINPGLHDKYVAEMNSCLK
jgi:hypothetical protein